MAHCARKPLPPLAISVVGLHVQPEHVAHEGHEANKDVVGAVGAARTRSTDEDEEDGDLKKPRKKQPDEDAGDVA